ncbi:valine--pyruvate transaminase [Teredinibacter turnerae]|uniref:valine--pyruvate transaminase n=1 Tax=Teredinibacter turnerae TaxID=2426 RepID=UPI0004199E46|nr:valine--pyruvate transaminase [Teredinibacter turnerae]
MNPSSFAQKFTGDAAIVDLMEDLGDALNVNPDLLFLGGGNPAHIPEFEARIGEHLKAICDQPAELHKLIGIYQSPQGNEAFIDALASYLQQRYQWPVTTANIAVANGSQSAFFILLNLLAAQGQICLPMMPEYLGYRDQGLGDNIFKGYRPRIELIGEHRFKYHIDFAALEITSDTAALCVSRPTNPSGNVVSDDEMRQLQAIAREHNIPLIVDCAYGFPFPGVVYQEAESFWDDNTILMLSLSKLGLPGVRTGIVVAPEAVIKKFVSANTIISLACGNLGPMLMNSLMAANELDSICETVIQPYYRAKQAYMLEQIDRHLAGLNYRVHESEGAFFVWIWFPNLPVSSEQLYQRMKEANVLIMAGEHFFFGMDENWDHAHQCIRLNFCQAPEVISDALQILAREVRALG